MANLAPSTIPSGSIDSMTLKTLLAERRSIEKKKIKRKGSSLLDRFFPKVKRARRTESNTNMTITDNKKKSKPSLDKSRRKEVKRRLNEEANKEIVPLAVGTLAMMGSALSNQGKYACNVTCMYMCYDYFFILKVYHLYICITSNSTTQITWQVIG